MADEQNIDFRLNTQADPKGADDILAKLDALKKRAEDVMDAHKKAAEEERKNAEEEKRNATESEIRQRVAADGWAKVSDKIREYGTLIKQNATELRGLSSEQQQFIAKTGEAMEVAGSFGSAVATGFSRGGPIGAVVAGAVNAATQIYDSWKEVDTELNKAEDSIRNSIAAQQRLNEVKAKLPLADAAREASALLDEVYQKAIRNERIAESERSLKQTQVDEAGKAGVASGAITEQQAEAASKAQELKSAGEKIVQDLDTTAKQIADLRGKAESAKQDAGLMAEFSDDQIKKLDDAKKLTDQANQLSTKLSDDLKIATNKLSELGTKAKGEAENLGQESLDAIEKTAQQEREALRAAVQEKGANATYQAKAALEILDDIFKDGQLRADEVGKYKEAQGRLNGAVEKNHTGVMEAFQEGQKLLAAHGTEIVNIKNEFARMVDDFTQQIRAVQPR